MPLAAATLFNFVATFRFKGFSWISIGVADVIAIASKRFDKIFLAESIWDEVLQGYKLMKIEKIYCQHLYACVAQCSYLHGHLKQSRYMRVLATAEIFRSIWNRIVSDYGPTTRGPDMIRSHLEDSMFVPRARR
jgi:hypothetical protein